jgi:predicted MFS family arabinose efflux permease
MYWVIWAIVIGAYLAVSVFAAYMTWREHQRNGHVSLVMTGISYLLCAAWPLAATVLFTFAQWHPAEFVPADRN